MSAAESNHAQRVLSALNQQRAVGRFCDASLNVGDGVVFLAHRNILACFTELLQQSNMPSATEFCLQGCPSDGLELLLNFVYTGELKLDPHNLDRVQQAAASLCVPEALTRCQQFKETSKEPVPVKRKRGRPRKSASDITKYEPTIDTAAASFTAAATTTATTTRSGRVVKGSRRLVTIDESPTCSQCPKTFLTRAELRVHEAAKHRGEKPFVCEECGHRASSRNGLQMHIKAIHRNERPFVCNSCGHAFSQKNNLNMHLRIHSGERPYQCHLCGKTFRTQASLDKHHRTHTGERPFGCDVCEQRFTEKGALLRHKASKHEEGRPHCCHICGKTFKAREQLRVHLRRHKGMRKFECVDCGYKFTRQVGSNTEM
ncbi:telomere zinc finger-associated protein-like [Neolamprologus brichardi]|uniref:telomere zinc finger-associated protein-like n=1 Tax=Neolamprologus brichardi TaxID=32507 RepID=UPI001643C610|nr:telomere zinc finger-associated protein-like [Neolamprologus brichardi]